MLRKVGDSNSLAPCEALAFQASPTLQLWRPSMTVNVVYGFDLTLWLSETILELLGSSKPRLPSRYLEGIVNFWDFRLDSNQHAVLFGMVSY